MLPTSISLSHTYTYTHAHARTHTYTCRHAHMHTCTLTKRHEIIIARESTNIAKSTSLKNLTFKLKCPSYFSLWGMPSSSLDFGDRRNDMTISIGLHVNRHNVQTLTNRTLRQTEQIFYMDTPMYLSASDCENGKDDWSSNRKSYEG